MSQRTWSLLLVVFCAAMILPGCPGEKQPAAPKTPAATGPADKPAPAPEALSPEAKALLEKAIAAAGGEENLKKLDEFTTKSHGRYMGMPYTATNTFIPGEMRMDIDMPNGEHMAMVMGLKNCWSRTGPVVVPCPVGERESARQQAIFEKASKLLPIARGEFAAKVTEVTIDGQAHPALEVSGGGLSAPGKLVFDPKTHLMVQTTFQGAMQGVRGTFVTTLSDYKDSCGVKQATKFSMSFGGNPVMNETITEQHCGPVDDNLFPKPLQVADGTLVEKTMPAATVLCTTHQGDYSGLGRAIGELMGHLGKKGLSPMGAPTMIYVKAPPEAKTPAEYVTDVCVPVSLPAPPTPQQNGAFVLKAQAQAKVLSIYGLGDYTKKSGELAKRLMAALTERKLAPKGPMRQVTYMNPMAVPAADLVSEMQIPIE